MTDFFVEIMQQHLGVQAEAVKIQDEWTTSGPEGLRDTPLGGFLRHVSRRSQVFVNLQ